MSRTLFIGDIHGCYDELVELYGKMKVQEGDTVYATGDLIHGGPFSQKVVQFLREKNIQSVLGNHDVAFLQGLSDDSRKREWHDEVAAEFVGHDSDITYLQSLPYWIESEDFLLIHAGLVPGIPLEKQEKNSLVKIREYEGKPWHDFYEGEKLIIYGHWAVQGLRMSRNTLCIDTGCVWGGYLTGYCLESGEIWQERSYDAYRKYWKNDKI